MWIQHYSMELSVSLVSSSLRQNGLHMRLWQGSMTVSAPGALSVPFYLNEQSTPRPTDSLNWVILECTLILVWVYDHSLHLSTEWKQRMEAYWYSLTWRVYIHIYSFPKGLHSDMFPNNIFQYKWKGKLICASSTIFSESMFKSIFLRQAVDFFWSGLNKAWVSSDSSSKF